MNLARLFPPDLFHLAVSRLGNFDISKIAPEDRTNIVLASIDATEQLLACPEVQKLLIPMDHFDDDPSADIEEELAKVVQHLKDFTILVTVEQFSKDAEVSSFGISQAFEQGFTMRLNANIFSRPNLVNNSFQRCEMMFPSCSSTQLDSRLF